MKKKILAVVLAMAMAVGLIACSSGPAEVSTQETAKEETAPEESTETNDEAYKIGFALQTLDVAVWERMVEGMQAKADEMGVEFQCLVADSNVATQIANIENMIAQDFDAIIVHVFDTEAFADVVQQALDAGIIICAYDDTIVGSDGEALDYQFSFVCDNYEIGYRVGTMAAEWTLATFEGDDTIQFGQLWHPEYKLQWDRVDGMKAALAELDPRVEIVEDLEGLLVNDGVAAAEAWMQTYPNLKGVVATNDTCLQGFAEAWSAAGKDIHDPNFGMFGNDGVKDAIDLIADDAIIRGDVGLDVYSGGADTVEACVSWLNGTETEDVIMPMINVTADTVQDWIADPTLY